jgi:hypothetical protein
MPCFHYPNALFVGFQCLYVAMLEDFALGLAQRLFKTGNASIGFAISGAHSSDALSALLIIANGYMKRVWPQPVLAHLLHQRQVPFTHASFYDVTRLAAYAVEFLGRLVVRDEFPKTYGPGRSRPACRVQTVEIGRGHSFESGRVMN